MLMWKRSDLVKRPQQVPSERSCSRLKLVAVFISRSLWFVWMVLGEPRPGWSGLAAITTRRADVRT